MKPRQGMPWLRGEATGLPGLWTANQQRGASHGWNPPPSGGWRMSTVLLDSRTLPARSDLPPTITRSNPSISASRPVIRSRCGPSAALPPCSGEAPVPASPT